MLQSSLRSARGSYPRRRAWRQLQRQQSRRVRRRRRTSRTWRRGQHLRQHPAAARRRPLAAPPAPHVAAPRVAAASHRKRHASRVTSAPRAAPQAHRAAPQQLARPSGGSAPAAGARRQKERTVVAPRPRRRRCRLGTTTPTRRSAGEACPTHATRTAGRQPRRARSDLPSARIAPGDTGKSSRAGRRDRPTRNRCGADRILRNQAFASRPGSGGRNAPALARSTFQGRFFDPGWQRHRSRPIVIGWVGPMFWPYAYDDFVDYTFYPHAYDTFWPYAYDDLYEGAFRPLCLGLWRHLRRVGRADAEIAAARAPSAPTSAPGRPRA